MRRKVILIVLALALAGCQTTYESAERLVGSAMLAGRDGAIGGSARLFSLGDSVTINVALQGLPAEVHEVHLDAVGDCSAADFSSAGEQLTPQGIGPRIESLPDLRVGADGAGTMSAALRGTEAEVLSAIFDADGTAVVVQAGEHGARLACGVLRPA